MKDRQLISRLVGDPEAIAKLYDTGFHVQVFEDPLSSLAYDFVIEYWLESGKTAAPTADIIEKKFPPFKVCKDTEEEAWWLAKQLEDRLATNAVQEIVLEDLKTTHTDPVGTLAKLQKHVTEKLDLIRARADLKFEADVSNKLYDRKVREEVDRRYAALGTVPGSFDDEFLFGDQLDELPKAEPLIEGVLTRHAYSVLRGRDHSFKSFIALDWSAVPGHRTALARAARRAGQGALRHRRGGLRPGATQAGLGGRTQGDGRPQMVRGPQVRGQPV